MFKTLASRVPKDADLPDRAHKLDVLSRVLDDSLYDVLDHSFADEYNGSGEYIPLKNRRPSVNYPLCRNITVESTALLFGENKFPHIDCEDRQTRDAIKALIKETKLNSTMLDAAIKGSVGSIAIRMRVLRGRVFFDALSTAFLTPEYDPEEPDKLLRVIERYKVNGQALVDTGYHGIDPVEIYWFRREFDRTGEQWFQPQSITDAQDGKAPVLDLQRSVHHVLGFVPVVWIKNLPGGDELDGACTFAPAISASIEINYHLSQAGRGLKYQSDPTLVLKNPSGISDGQLVRGASNAINVDQDGDAKLLQLDGNATAAVIEYVRTLREFGLESVRGNRASPERLSAAQSGRALEVMAAGLRALADDLRLQYGEGGILSLMRMVIEASHKYPLKVSGKIISPIPLDTVLSLRWPKYFAEDAEDRQAEAMRLDTLTKQGLLSKETATASLAESFDIEDLPAELARIEQDNKTKLAEVALENRQLRVTE